jgi:DNA repair protein RadD
MFEPRWYQREAVDSVVAEWKNGVKSTLVDAPCGAGKSIILAMIASEFAKKYSGARILCLAHVKELLVQNEQATKLVWSGAPTGMWSAGVGRKEYDRIMFAGIQSFEGVVEDYADWDIVMIDECHLIPPRSNTRYKKVLDIIKERNPKVRIVGLSATPYRMDNGHMVGEGQFFETEAYSIPIQTLIDEGSLCNVTSEGSIYEADLSTVKTRMGEYEVKTLEQAFKTITKDALNDCQQTIRDRNATLIFCTSVLHANIVKDELAALGIGCEVVSGDTKKDERDRICKDFKEGRIKCLANVNVLTTGTNFPICDTLILLTATQSVSKYVQIIGRGMRIHPDKESCVVLDFGGNAERHGPIDDINIKARQANGGDGEAPGKYCGKVDGSWIPDQQGNPGCKMVLATAVRECPNCGYLFPPPKPKIKTIAQKGAILKQDLKKPHYADIKTWTFYKKVSQAGNEMVVIEFFADDRGIGDASKFVSFSAATSKYKLFLMPGSKIGKAKVQMVKFKKALGVDCDDDMESLLEAIRQKNPPKQILAKKDGKYWSVLDVVFD